MEISLTQIVILSNKSVTLSLVISD